MKKDSIQTRKRKPKGGMKSSDTPIAGNVAGVSNNNTTITTANNNNNNNNNSLKLEPGTNCNGIGRSAGPVFLNFSELRTFSFQITLIIVRIKFYATEKNAIVSKEKSLIEN